MKRWVALFLLALLWSCPGAQAEPFMYDQYPYFYQPTISTITIADASDTYAPGQTITVSMTGTHGGQAWFDITRLATRVPMHETTRGTYVGSFTIPQDAHAFNEHLYATLTYGGTVHAQADYTINVGDRTLFLTVASPQGQRDAMFINGMSLPGAQITVTTTSQNAGQPPILLHKTVTADSHGQFHIPIWLNHVSTVNGQVALTVTACEGTVCTQSALTLSLGNLNSTN